MDARELDGSAFSETVPLGSFDIVLDKGAVSHTPDERCTNAACCRVSGLHGGVCSLTASLVQVALSECVSAEWSRLGK